MLSDQEKKQLSALAIDRLYTDERAGKPPSVDLVEVIAACIQQADDTRLEILKGLLE